MQRWTKKKARMPNNVKKLDSRETKYKLFVLLAMSLLARFDMRPWLLNGNSTLQIRLCASLCYKVLANVLLTSY